MIRLTVLLALCATAAYGGIVCDLVADDYVDTTPEDTNPFNSETALALNLVQPGCAHRNVSELVYILFDPPGLGLMKQYKTTGAYEYRPPLNFFGNITFMYVINSPMDDTSSPPATVTIVVTPVNDCPLAQPVPPLVFTSQGHPVTIILNGTGMDIEDDVLTYHFVPLTVFSPMFPRVLGGDVTIDPVSSVAVFTPNASIAGMGFNGGAFAFLVSDGICNSSAQIQLITIIDTPPVAANASHNVLNSTFLVQRLDVRDAGLPVMQYKIIDGIPNGTGTLMLDAVTGYFTYMPTLAVGDAVSFTFCGVDSMGSNSNIGTITITSVAQVESQSMSQSAPPSMSPSTTAVPASSTPKPPKNSSKVLSGSDRGAIIGVSAGAGLIVLGICLGFMVRRPR